MSEKLNAKFLPLIDHEANRQRFITDMRAALDFLEKNPEIPAPTENYAYDFTYGSFNREEFESTAKLLRTTNESVEVSKVHGTFTYRWICFGTVRLIALHMSQDGAYLGTPQERR